MVHECRNLNVHSYFAEIEDEQISKIETIYTKKKDDVVIDRF